MISTDGLQWENILFSAFDLLVLLEMVELSRSRNLKTFKCKIYLWPYGRPDLNCYFIKIWS